MRLSSAVKWYSKGLFPHPQTEFLLGIIFITQYYILTDQSLNGNLDIVTQFLLIPLVVLFNGLFFVRDKDITIFEIYLLKSRSNVSLGRTIAIFLSFVPFLIVEALLLVVFKWKVDFLFVVISIMVNASFVLIASLLESFSSAFIVIVCVSFLLPLSSIVLFQNYSFLKLQVGQPLSAVLYVVSPLLTFQSYQGHIVQLSPSVGILVAFAFSIFVIIVYQLLFNRVQFKP